MKPKKKKTSAEVTTLHYKVLIITIIIEIIKFILDVIDRLSGK